MTTAKDCKILVGYLLTALGVLRFTALHYHCLEVARSTVQFHLLWERIRDVCPSFDEVFGYVCTSGMNCDPERLNVDVCCIAVDSVLAWNNLNTSMCPDQTLHLGKVS